MTFEIVPERPSDAALIDALLDRTFGYDRKQRTVYRLRDGITPISTLSFSAIEADGGLLGSIRFWAVYVGSGPGILLGPLAVEPSLQGQGIGRALVRHSLAEAEREGHALCLVVGDPDYYRPFGFVPAAQAGIILTGPVEPERFQAMALKPGALEGEGGLVRRATRSRLGIEGTARRA
jgi:predicted N-acetyltransferase YhbS